jgi:hypothetical protein
MNRQVLCDLRYVRVKRGFNEHVSPPDKLPTLDVTIDPDMGSMRAVHVQIMAEDAAAFAEELIAAASLIKAEIIFEAERQADPTGETLISKSG